MWSNYKIILVILLSFNCQVFSQSDSKFLEKGLLSITKTDLMKSVSYLSSRELAGRLSGSLGYNRAAEFVSKKFRELKVKPLGDKNSGYYQKLNVEYNEIIPPLKLTLIKGNRAEKVYKLGKDFVARGFTGSGNFTAQIVFCGYGISRPEIGYDDYQNVDVNGKIAMVFKYNPRWKLNDSIQWGDGSPRYKAKVAKQHGAIGLFFVSTPDEPTPQKTIISILDGEGLQDENFPSLHISIDVANELLQFNKITLKEVQRKIDSAKLPFSFRLGSKVQVEVNAKYSKEKQTMNVVGMIEGSDKKLKDEYVIIGAHLDHVGSQANEIYAPGANDNASGSAAVLEIAEAFVKSGVKPKRSVIFILFASEELGLFGSRHFVNNSPVPIEKIVAMINLDCVGFGDSIQVGNGKSAPALWQIAKSLDSIHTKQMVMSTWSGGGADASPFHDKGIPTLYFVTTNSYANLHYISDTPETLNQTLFENITKLAFLTAYNIANGEYQREIVLK